MLEFSKWKFIIKIASIYIHIHIYTHTYIYIYIWLWEIVSKCCWKVLDTHECRAKYSSKWLKWNTHDSQGHRVEYKRKEKRRRGTPLQHYSRYVKISAALSASILTKHIGGGQGYPFHVRQRMFLFVYLHIALGCINSISKRFQRRPSPWNFNLLIKVA